MRSKLLPILIAGGLLAGCQSVPVYEQTTVAQPSMQFADTPVHAYNTRLLSTLEPGTAASAGASASGCTSCR